MAERPPNRFNKKPANLEDLLKSSESEDSEESEESTRPVRIRQKTARYVDEVSPQQVAMYKASKRRKIQSRTSQLEELKKEDKEARRRQSSVRPSRQSESAPTWTWQHDPLLRRTMESTK